MTLSKSDYMLFLRHPAWLWLKKFEKHKLPEISEDTQDRFDDGHDFEIYAEKLFPNAKRIGFTTYKEYENMPDRTELALSESNTILQGRFEADGLTCIIDVLNKLQDNTYELIEIKSSTKAKPEHFYDMAFQSVVLEKYGIHIKKYSIIYVNNEYIRNGKVEPDKLTTIADVTDSVTELIDLTINQIQEAIEILSQKVIPDISPRYVNKVGVPRTKWFSEWIEIYKHLNPNLDPYSIYALGSPNSDQIGKLEDLGITLIQDIPGEIALRSRQLSQIETTKENKRIIDKDKIKEFLDTFKYPLYFFDYETLSSLIPAFDGFKPYKDYPFQYSLHILDKPNGKLRHEEYLHNENSDPMPKLLKKLKQDIGNSGTIITWHMSYEKSCNETMGKFYPEYKEFLNDLNNRINDLKIPFSEMWFVDKDFFGSASIKKVLPVLVPELNHKDLDVSEGLKARRIWTETVLEGKNQDKKEEILKELVDYCTLDTFAMVKILEELKNLTK